MSRLLYDGFYDARVAREIALGSTGNGGVVLGEINTLQVLIDNAAGSSRLEIEVTDDTEMTENTLYYQAWVDPQTYNSDAHNLARARMNKVINYFTRLGYQIKREQDGTSNFIKWKIKW